MAAAPADWISGRDAEARWPGVVNRSTLRDWAEAGLIGALRTGLGTKRRRVYYSAAEIAGVLDAGWTPRRVLLGVVAREQLAASTRRAGAPTGGRYEDDPIFGTRAAEARR